MSAKPETTFIHSVHKHLRPTIYHMKNHNPYVSGVPDVWYSGEAGDLWVEYKFIKLPKQDTTPINLNAGKGALLSKLQQVWLEARCAEGRSVGVIVGCKEGGCWFPDNSWNFRVPLLTGTFRKHLKSRATLAELIHEHIGG